MMRKITLGIEVHASKNAPAKGEGVYAIAVNYKLSPNGIPIALAAASSPTIAVKAPTEKRATTPPTKEEDQKPAFDCVMLEDFSRISFSKSLQVDANDSFYNDIVQSPDLFVVQLLQGRDAHSLAVIATAVVDILPLLRNNSRVLEEWLAVTPLNGMNPMPNFQIQTRVVLSEPLLTQDEKEHCNYMTVHVESMQNLPMSWIPKEPQTAADHIFEYAASVILPINAKEEKECKITGGRLYFKAIEDENGSSKTIPVIIWENGKKTFYMGKEAMDIVEKASTQNKAFNGTISRSIRADKIKEGWVDENEKKYQGVFQFGVPGVLEPGVKTCSTTFRVGPVPPKPEEDAEAKKKPPKSREAQKRKQNKKNPIPEELFAEPDEEVHPYDKEQSKITVNVEFESSIIPLPQDRVKPKMKPSDLIPRRKKVEKKIDPVERYKNEITAIVEMLALDYIKTNSLQPVDKEKFIFELNNSGKYFAFKEKLKQTIIAIIKEKYAKEIQATKKLELEKFYNDFYIYLVQQMHVAINKIFEKSTKNESGVVSIDGKPTDRWRRWADEAEYDMNFPLAAKYHQERLANEPENALLWFEFAMFCMRANDIQTAEQALKEVLTLDMSNLHALRAYGVLLCMKQQYKEAEVFIQSAVDIDNTSYLSWGLLLLYFQLVEKDKEANQTFALGKRAYNLYRSSNPSVKVASFRVELANYLLELHAHILAEKVLLDEVNTEDNTVDSFLGFAKLYLIREDFVRAEDNLNSSLQIQFKSSQAWTLMGHVHYLQNRIPEAEQAYEKAISMSQECVDAILFLRLGSVYLKQEKYDQARTSYLQAAKNWPCGISWLGVGIAYLRLGDLVHSEQALNEANIQNNLNANIWAYLALNCILSGRFEEAENSLREALRLKLGNKEAIAEIMQAYQAAGKTKEANSLKQLL